MPQRRRSLRSSARPSDSDVWGRARRRTPHIASCSHSFGITVERMAGLQLHTQWFPHGPSRTGAKHVMSPWRPGSRARSGSLPSGSLADGAETILVRVVIKLGWVLPIRLDNVQRSFVVRSASTKLGLASIQSGSSPTEFGSCSATSWQVLSNLGRVRPPSAKGQFGQADHCAAWPKSSAQFFHASREMLCENRPRL